MILTFIEHAENFRWSINVRMLHLNIFILDLNPFIEFFATEQFLEIDKKLFCSEKYFAFDFFLQKCFKTRINRFSRANFLFIFGLKNADT